MQTIWVIVPTYNERENIAELAKRLFAQTIPHELHLLVVDDSSPDGTADLVAALAVRNTNIHLLQKAAKQGLGDAYRTGFTYAIAHGATVLGEMDADLSHLPEEFPKLVAALNGSVDVVIGSRRIAGGKIIGWNAWRRFTSRAATAISRFVLGLRTHDATSGFRLYRVHALDRIPWKSITSNGYAWQEEILYLLERRGIAITEIPITFVDRAQGKSKLGVRDVIEFFVTLWRLKTNQKTGS